MLDRKGKRILKFFIFLYYLEELPGDPLIVHLDLADHVAGDVAAEAPALAPVEPVRVLLPDYLKTTLTSIVENC